MSKLDIFLLDNINNVIEEVSINRPRTYPDLERQIMQKFKNLPKSYDKFIFRNQEIFINQVHKYKNVNDLLFIRDNEGCNVKRSSISVILDNLPASQQQKYEDKFNCTFCLELIKNESPYLCYKCQKIFHQKCLKDWDNKCKSQNKVFNCPNCRNELPIEKWNKKLEHEENRKDFATLINKVYQDKLSYNLYKIIYFIKEKKINDLILNKKKINENLNKYKNYVNKSIAIFNDTINQINSMLTLLNLEKNNRLNELMKILPSNLEKINDMSNLLNEEFQLLKNKISKNNLENKKNINNNKYKNLKKNKEIEIFYNKIKKLQNNLNHLNQKNSEIKPQIIPEFKFKESNNQKLYDAYESNGFNTFKQKKENINNTINNKINDDIPSSLTDSQVRNIINMSNLPETFGSANINKINNDKSEFSIETNVPVNINYDLNQITYDEERYSLDNNQNKKKTENTQKIEKENYFNYFQYDQSSSNQFIQEKNYLNEQNYSQGENINLNNYEQNINDNYNEDINKIIFDNIEINPNEKLNNQNQFNIQNYTNQNNFYNLNNQQIINDDKRQNSDYNQNYLLNNNYNEMNNDKIAKVTKVDNELLYNFKGK